MSQDDDRQRTKQERIKRLRERLKSPAFHYTQFAEREMLGVLRGILDLLADEL